MKPDNEAKQPKKQVREWQAWQPHEFLPSHCLDLIKIMGQGLGYQTFAANNNLSRAKFYVWLKTYTDFGLAYEIGKSYADRYLIRLLDDYKIEIGPEGTERLNINVWRELHKLTRASVEKKESLMILKLDTPRSMMTAVLEALGQGMIEMEEAERLASLIETTQRITETSELVKRIEELEVSLKTGARVDDFVEE